MPYFPRNSTFNSRPKRKMQLNALRAFPTSARVLQFRPSPFEEALKHPHNKSSRYSVVNVGVVIAAIFSAVKIESQTVLNNRNTAAKSTATHKMTRKMYFARFICRHCAFLLSRLQQTRVYRACFAGRAIPIDRSG